MVRRFLLSVHLSARPSSLFIVRQMQVRTFAKAWSFLLAGVVAPELSVLPVKRSAHPHTHTHALRSHPTSPVLQVAVQLSGDCPSQVLPVNHRWGDTCCVYVTRWDWRPGTVQCFDEPEYHKGDTFITFFQFNKFFSPSKKCFERVFSHILYLAWHCSSYSP